MARPARSALLLLVTALALAGCSRQEAEISANEQVPAEDRTEATPTQDEGGTEGPAVPTWVAVDIAYDAAPSEIPAGGISVQLINEGAIQHNVVIDDLGPDPILLANPGETVEGTLTLEPGEYHYHCSIPGHEKFMSGTVTVS